MTSRTVKVPNISCGHCVGTIQREVGEVDGVQSVKADVASRKVEIEWDETRTTWEAIKRVMEEIHYAPVE